MLEGLFFKGFEGVGRTKAAIFRDFERMYSVPFSPNH